MVSAYVPPLPIFICDRMMERKANTTELLVKKGRSIVRPEFAEEWELRVRAHDQNPWNLAVDITTFVIMEKLSEGGDVASTVGEIMDRNSRYFSGPNIERVVELVVHFHPRGEEVKKWWGERQVGAFPLQSVERKR